MRRFEQYSSGFAFVVCEPGRAKYPMTTFEPNAAPTRTSISTTTNPEQPGEEGSYLSEISLFETILDYSTQETAAP